ncbi:chromosome partitioning protein ParA [Pandoraea pnomenusa]|uniref:Chromosome partitioning protein ParA n=1 Tax=Pandoraea pnomenusa TaxID=93220 RepID=A0ABY6WMN4_9BURK|nr:ParA family protein [Pandoraea pnomenusa]VVE69787.1 chromosome partitioning protein ParA [Pandoraea pnomenusa]
MKPHELPRHSAIRLALYNHKGGVGKTSLTVNLAAALGATGKRVLIVDSDPQCNITSFLVEPDVVDSWLDGSDVDTGKTLWTGLKPVMESTGPARKVSPIERMRNVFLLPGDIKISDFEIDLHQFWSECYQRKNRGFLGTTALSTITNIAATEIDADYVFYDVGPNIGPLNRAVLLDCDFFAVPAACDLFSIRALKTLGHTLANWITDCRVLEQLAPDGVPLLPGHPSFLGYILQRFRVYGGQITSGFSPYISHLEKAAMTDIVKVLKRLSPSLASGSSSEFKLGQIKDFGAIAALSQSQGKPFKDVDGAPADRRNDAARSFATLAQTIEDRIQSQSL